jgi:hypothetical protein
MDSAEKEQSRGSVNNEETGHIGRLQADSTGIGDKGICVMVVVSVGAPGSEPADWRPETPVFNAPETSYIGLFTLQFDTLGGHATHV